MSVATPVDLKDRVPAAVQANKEHQYALKVYTDRLETELKHLDKLLAAVEVSEDEEDEEPIPSGGGYVVIPGAVRPRGPVSIGDLLDESSPFYRDAMRRQTYQEFIEFHPMKAQELDALTDAVRSENYRLHALEAQARGLPPFMPGTGQAVPDFTMNKEGIDWERVAQKVTLANSTVQRSAKECEIRWLGERHPQFINSQWTQSEIARVKQLVATANEGEVDWVEIAKKLGTGRTPVDCLRNAIVRKTHTWTPETDERLLKAVDVYGTGSWGLVARMVSEDATAAQCQNRYTRSLDPELSRGPWTPEEDEQLRRAVDVFGKTWVDVCQYVAGRNSEQCRDRYQEYLNPTLTRGKWTPEQDAALLRAVEQAGEGKWKEVSKLLNNGRTDNMCRTRYNIIVKRTAQGMTPEPEDHADSRESSQAPSTSKRLPPRRTVPPNPEEILILHPESYRPRASTNTPVVTPTPATGSTPTAPASTPVPEPAPNAATSKPKPKPRPRRKQAPVPENTAGSAQPMSRTTETTAEASQPSRQQSLPTGSKRAASADAEGSHSSKRPRRVEPNAVLLQGGASGEDAEQAQGSAVPVPFSCDERELVDVDVPNADSVSKCSGSDDPEAADQVAVDEGASDDSAPTNGRGRGRGRGRARGRGRGRGRARPPGRRLKEAEDTTAPTSTRRQPPRAAHKSQASTSAHQMDVDS